MELRPLPVERPLAAPAVPAAVALQLRDRQRLHHRGSRRRLRKRSREDRFSRAASANILHQQVHRSSMTTSFSLTRLLCVRVRAYVRVCVYTYIHIYSTEKTG